MPYIFITLPTLATLTKTSHTNPGIILNIGAATYITVRARHTTNVWRNSMSLNSTFWNGTCHITVLYSLKTGHATRHICHRKKHHKTYCPQNGITKNHVLPVPFFRSCSGCPIIAVPCWLSFSDCPILSVFPSSPVLAELCWHPCRGSPILAV